MSGANLGLFKQRLLQLPNSFVIFLQISMASDVVAHPPFSDTQKYIWLNVDDTLQYPMPMILKWHKAKYHQDFLHQTYDPHGFPMVFPWCSPHKHGNFWGRWPSASPAGACRRDPDQVGEETWAWDLEGEKVYIV